MPVPAASEIVIPKDMTPAARQHLADTLYDVHCQIFTGVEKRAFVRYVIESKAEHTWILLHKDAAGNIVGYIALHIFERVVDGELVAILRGEAGMLSAYRGGNVNAPFAIERVLRYMAAHPGRRMMLLSTLVHPSSYAQISRYADRVYPSPAAETPADIAGLMRDLAEEFHLDRVDEANPMIYKVGWRTIDSSRDRARWQASENPSVRYFVEANPGFAEGHGLLTVVPVTLGCVVRAGGRFAASKASAWLRKATAWAGAQAPASA
ncbi:hypothetical protein WME79_11880 [Sorangium sp. So ce726]|uniref:hypothetical protein n=1 Tax=Sorangium sp. So ce726 TaxID=3133319 RepID=UPI003F62BC3A